MPKIDLKTIIAFVNILPGIISAGEDAWSKIRAALVDGGADADTIKLLEVERDAERRRLISEGEAQEK